LRDVGKRAVSGLDGNGDPDYGRKIERAPTSREFSEYRPVKRSAFGRIRPTGMALHT